MRTLYILLIFSILIVQRCTLPLDQDNQVEDENLKSTSGNIRSLFLSQTVTDFSTNMSNNLFSDASRLNSVLFSPLSIYLALSLLYPGTRDETKIQLAKTLGLSNDIKDTDFQDNIHDLLESYKSLLTVNPTKIALANALFPDNSFSIMPDYKNIITNVYQGHVDTLNFSNQIDSAGRINGWVRNRTQGLITRLVEPTSINGDTRMLLLNAVYFKANWQYKFDPTKTKTGTFYTNSERTKSVEVEMMHQDENLLVGRDDELQADILSLQYEDPNFTMMIFLPDQNQNVNSLLKSLGSKNFSDIHTNLEYRLTEVQMPKFKIEYKTRLISALKKMGLTDIFDEKTADLSGISLEKDLAVTDMLHKAVVEVNEEGSEAVAVTAISIAIRGGFRKGQFIMDRPFVFVIQDLKNHLPLFLGHTLNPSTKEATTVQKDLYDYYDDTENKQIGLRTNDDGISICVSFNPCINGGKCASSATDLQEYVCVCPKEFQGKQCQLMSNSIQDDIIAGERSVNAILGDKDVYQTGHSAGDNCEPGYNFTASENGNETEPVRFPCPHTENTQPIKDYISKHGDPSLFGHKGEKAKLPL